MILYGFCVKISKAQPEKVGRHAPTFILLFRRDIGSHPRASIELFHLLPPTQKSTSYTFMLLKSSLNPSSTIAFLKNRFAKQFSRRVRVRDQAHGNHCAYFVKALLRRWNQALIRLHCSALLCHGVRSSQVLWSQLMTPLLFKITADSTSPLTTSSASLFSVMISLEIRSGDVRNVRDEDGCKRRSNARFICVH